MKMMREPEAWLTSPVVVTAVVVGYVVLLLTLLLAELGVPGLGWLRATNQVLVLMGLLFLPFLVLSAGRVVRSISVKLSGQELHLELNELRHDLQVDVNRVEARFADQVSTAEQALWPMLAGHDPKREERWRNRTVIVGAKLDPSQMFFAHLLAVWLEKTLLDVRCIVRAPNGGSLKNFADVKYGWVDAYIDYTGTCCQYFNIDHRKKTQSQIIETLNAYGEHIGLRWLDPLGATENYCLVMRKACADQEGIRTIKDLAHTASKLVFAADPEFLNRRDCFLGLSAQYDLAFRRIESCRITSRYAHLEAEQADVVVGYETDPELQSPAMVVLKDSDCFFPEYRALPLVSAGALQHVDGLEASLKQLRGMISTAELVHVVHKVRHRGQRPAVVRELAEQFLLEKQLT